MTDRSLQVEEDLRYQERSWIVQRVGWVFMLLAIIAAAAGIFGDGILAKASVGNNHGLRIDFERFLRSLKPASLTIHTRADSINDIRIRINSDFFQAVRLQKIVPEPTDVETGDKWLSYKFTVDTPGAVMIRFDLIPEKVGPLAAQISAGEEQLLSFRQFVYP